LALVLVLVLALALVFGPHSLNKTDLAQIHRTHSNKNLPTV
jgi:hypothetical protein